jgi:membrane associated rhomboid family serine protease
MTIETNSNIERKKIILAMIIPGSFLFVCWLIFLLEFSLDISFSEYGLRPRDLSQWFGIITMPFLHGDIQHILANSISFMILGTMVFYFYSQNSISIFIWSFFLTGILTWLIGRGNIHIGASGMVYAFAGYLFTAGVISKNMRLMAISLVVVFLYGSMIWGIFPQNTNISWEGHLSGFAAGIGLAFIYRPPKPIVIEDDEEDDDDTYYTDFYDETMDCTEHHDKDIKYHFRNDAKK